jgi:hypothetical protein
MKPETVDYNKLSHTELVEQLRKREADEIILKQAQQFTCECGVQLSKSHKARHLRTKGHRAYETETPKQAPKNIVKDSKPRFNKDVESILKKQAGLYICECGKLLTKHHRYTHLSRQRHKDLLAQQVKEQE